MPDATLAELDRLAGLVERVTFHNEQSGFCVLRLKVKGERELVTLIGHTPIVSPGEYASASGHWVTDREHGRQFRAVFVKISPPTTLTGIERYLGSGMVKGIGPIYAGKLVKSFGAAVFEVIEQSPKRLREIQGIGEVRARKITSGWADQKVIRSIMVFLHAHGVSTSRAVRIFKTYGQGAIEIVRENPYRLAQDIRGIGFLSADTIAQKIGIAKDSPLRAQAGISYALTEASAQGHCGLPYAELVPLAVRLLDIPESIIEAAIAQEITDEVLYPDTVEGQPCVFLAPLYYAEQSIAAQIRRLKTGASTLPGFDADKAIPWLEQKLSIQLADSQREAIRLALSSKILVITGGPGVGKTTLVNSILTIMTVKGVKPLLCAPTGRAAKRLSESTGLEAKTIHRLLEVNPLSGQFKRNAENPLECDLLVADECSMIDVPLANQLLKAVATSTAMILVGDVDQLPSVGPGQFLTDLIDSGTVPVIRLTEVFRQAATSRIVRSAHQINQGVFPSLPNRGEASDFYLVAVEQPDVIARTVVDLVQTRLPRKFNVDPVQDIQVLCPMNRGITGARGINQALQQALNPPGEQSVDRFGNRFSVGDKVMQIENNYDRDVFNGDIGFVTGIDRDEEELAVTFDGRVVTYPFGELDELVLCYATTIHKSQGSEYPVVVIPISTQHYVMLKRNLIYTGITRGKRLVVLVGQKKALATAVKGKQVERRWSKLKERLSATGKY
ncbi:ATP-dependent RecD-like DNA helicase [Accumulibacter sp.]|uniref:SF1B family DNA helicase RecD2 n=1 Tax=Accumulibacter sp. TaxID=2053492 RepID=UPI0025EC0486|nr:ATP-dependent RecD-like DNA helicase [Accumulibacter sp.]MCM8595141.1 ATP-dependent RecD-like DNA helicase [Accumulibacter sp.]MCM8626196.1 ATP-dependent RecD-like DNA helicase [Accumulibacter sp.]MDS4049287.1 ATP-dependent RecD-like DNA helicase [Accumulibacter sp.]